MSFSLPLSPSSLASGTDALFSSVPAIRRRQIARVNAIHNGERFDHKQNRQYRNALYRSKLAEQKLSTFPGARESYKNNPRQTGSPQAFKILLAGKAAIDSAQTYNTDEFVDDGNAIFFSSFGVPGKPIKLNHYWIPEADIELSPDGLVYTINTVNESGVAFSMHMNFADNLASFVGKGSITQAEGMWAIGLQPWAVKFNVNVSVDCGAYKSTGRQTFEWDPNSPEWINAHWESNTMGFSYATVPGPPNPDPSQPPYNINVCTFTDAMDPDNPFELTKEDYLTGKFVTIMDGSIDPTAVYMSTTVRSSTDVPTPLATRSALSVSSVYPQQALWKFDNTGASFTGAYSIPASDKVFGTVGEVIFPPFITQPAVQGDHFFSTKVVPLPLPGASKSKSLRQPANPLTVTGLTNLDPMIPVSPDESSTGWVDIVAREANQDFNDIICYYMDDDIRTTFVQAAPYVLKDPQVKAIADDSPANKAFYKELQVPYVVSSLSRSTLPEAAQCNATRAAKQLEGLPAGSPVYKNQSDLLYRNRYNKHFGTFQLYLDDQKDNDYTSNIKEMVKHMKAMMKEQTAGANGPDSDKLLEQGEKEIEALGQWAIDRQLYWAMQLYYWCQAVYIPMLYAQSVNGKLSSTITKELKKYTATLGMLEESAQNENGQNFQQAFNTLVRQFQMGALIPQLVDMSGNRTDIDDLTKRMMWQFYEDNINSTDPDIVEQANLSKQLAQEDFLRESFLNNLNMAMRLGGTLGTWAGIVDLFIKLNEKSAFYKLLKKGAELSSTIMKMACVAFLVLPLLNQFGGWSGLSPEQQTGWIVSAAAIALTIVVKIAQGFIRMAAFWQGFGAISHNIRAFWGFGKYVADLGSAANNVANAFAKWMVRSGAEVMEMQAATMSVGLKVFGRSVGQFLANTVGVVLAAVNIVLSVMSAVNSDDPLQKALDSMMIVASALQLLAIGAAWLVSAGVISATNAIGLSVCSMIATWAGPLAILLAVVGIAIMIAMMCLKKDPPSPPQQFMDKYAQPAGLKMDLGLEIDYFNVVPPDSKNQSRNGISFEVVVGDNGKQDKIYLQCGSDVPEKSNKHQLVPATAVTYMPDTCWCVQSNMNGYANIYTYVLDAEGKRRVVCLSELEDGTVAAIPRPASTTIDPVTGKPIPVPTEIYNAELERQLWKMDITWAGPRAEREVDGETVSYGDSASFKIGRHGKLLAWVKTDTTWKLELTATASHEFTIRMQPIGPADFTYIRDNWELNTLSKDEENGVSFQGPTSLPLNWSVSPALPYYLELVGSGTNAGTIRQVAGVAPPSAAAKIYKVQASIVIVGTTMKQSTEVKIGVEEAPDVTVPTEDVAPALMLPSTAGLVGAPNTHIGQYPSPLPPGLQSPDYFLWSQLDQVAMNLHYTAQAAITRMQRSLPGQWTISPDRVSYEKIFFPSPPGPDATPALNAHDRLDYAGAVSAFVAQAIANADPTAQPNCNWNKAQGTIDNFNTQLYTHNYYNYLAWLQWNGSVAITGPHCTLQEYINLLTSDAYVSLMAGLQAQGRWPTASIDMFLHFLKMVAIGATDEQITQVYNQLCYPPAPPKLDPSGFPLIKPDTWKEYRGYISNVGISNPQLKVTGFGRSYMKYYPGAPGHFGHFVTYYADSDFLLSSGYWQKAPSNCCFHQDTPIVLADGVSSKPISSVQPGDQILSPTPDDEHATATVLYVSQPPQLNRSLYHYHDTPELAFTSTHPLLLGYDEAGLPVLGFADVDAAVAGNPLWAAFTVQAIPLDKLTQVANVDETHGSVFHDLMLTPNGPQKSPTLPSRFVVRNKHGKQLDVCSEAPDAHALPLVTQFLISLGESIAPAKDAHQFFPQGLAVGAVDYAKYIRDVRASSAEAALKSNTATTTDSHVDMATLLDRLHQGTLPIQVILDSLEAVIASLGLTIQAELDNAWRYVPSFSPGDAAQRVPVFSIHILQLRSDRFNDPLSAALKQHTDNLNISIHASGDTAAALGRVDTLAVRRIVGGKLFHLDAAVALQGAESPQLLTLRISAGSGVELVAQGVVHGDVVARWALHSPRANGFEHVGCVHISSGLAALQALRWKEAAYGECAGFAERYAMELGRAVGDGIRKSVDGS